jgi:hypothetical protein
VTHTADAGQVDPATGEIVHPEVGSTAASQPVRRPTCPDHGGPLTYDGAIGWFCGTLTQGQSCSLRFNDRGLPLDDATEQPPDPGPAPALDQPDEAQQVSGVGTALVDQTQPPPPEQVTPPARVLQHVRSGHVLTPAEIEHDLAAVLEKIDQGFAYQARVERELGDLEHRYSIDYARALASSPAGAADTRKAYAVLHTEDLAAELSVKRVQVKVVRDAMHNLRSMLTGVQSLARSVGASMGAAGQHHP